jgi:hypothetical protein
MAHDAKAPVGNADDRIREIPKWARRFARNQTVPVLVFQVIFVLGAALFAGFGCLIEWAYTHDQRALAVASVLGLCAFAVWWIWFSFFGAGGIIRQISERLSRGQGTAAIGAPACAAGRPLPLVGFLFMFCVLSSVALGVVGFWPVHYIQPVSAIYAVPFMLYLAAKQWNTSSPFMLLWPALYAVHAVLILAGAPISLGPGFDMFVPTVGYGFLAALAGHVYSRFALRRLRNLAAGSEAAEDAAGAQGDD